MRDSALESLLTGEDQLSMHERASGKLQIAIRGVRGMLSLHLRNGRRRQAKQEGR